MKRNPGRKQFLHEHSLSLVAFGIVLLLIGLYCVSNPATHVGSFFGNAIADWTGVLVIFVMTKHRYEKGSAESKKPRGKVRSGLLEFLREHSLTLFLWSPVCMGVGIQGDESTASGDKSWAISFRRDQIRLVLMTSG
jgi:hypothetical protein